MSAPKSMLTTANLSMTPGSLLSRDEFESYANRGFGIYKFSGNYGPFEVWRPYTEGAILVENRGTDVKILAHYRGEYGLLACEQACKVAKRLWHLFPLHFMAKEYPR